MVVHDFGIFVLIIRIIGRISDKPDIRGTQKEIFSHVRFHFSAVEVHYHSQILFICSGVFGRLLHFPEN